MDEGLGIGEGTSKDGKVYGTEFDVDNLLRMDSAAQMEVLDKGKNILTPDEARRRLSLPPTEGGNVVYRQQQDYSLAALAKRDAKEDPFAKDAPEPKPAPANENDEAAQAEAALKEARLMTYETIAATRRALRAARL